MWEKDGVDQVVNANNHNLQHLTVILHHFLLLPNVVQKDTCTVKLFQGDSIKQILTVWMSKNKWESKTVQYQLSYDWPDYAEQLHISAYWCCQYQICLHSYLVICVAFCGGLLPLRHSMPPTSKQVSNQEISVLTPPSTCQTNRQLPPILQADRRV
jgi:hypothetical protein